MAIDDEYTPLSKRHKSLRGGGILQKRGKSGWWVGGHTRKGRYGLYGPRDTEQEAAELGQRKGLVDQETVNLPTTDENKATRLMRARRLNGTASFDDVLDNMQHR